MPADRSPREVYRSFTDDWLAGFIETPSTRLEWGVTPPQRAERRRRRRREDERQIAFPFVRYGGLLWNWTVDFATAFDRGALQRAQRRVLDRMNCEAYLEGRTYAIPATATVQRIESLPEPVDSTPLPSDAVDATRYWRAPVPVPAETMWCRRAPCGDVQYNDQGEVVGGRSSSVPRVQWREHLEAIHNVCGYCEQPLEDGQCRVAGCNIFSNLERSNEHEVE
jgi:hypothetical protein